MRPDPSGCVKRPGSTLLGMGKVTGVLFPQKSTPGLKYQSSGSETDTKKERADAKSTSTVSADLELVLREARLPGLLTPHMNTHPPLSTPDGCLVCSGRDELHKMAELSRQTRLSREDYHRVRRAAAPWPPLPSRGL